MTNPAPKLTWFGHNCFLFEYNGVRFLVDPFLADGVAPASAADLRADYLLVSHGHADHCDNALEIAKRSHGTVVAIAEVAGYFARKGVKTEAGNIGGAIYLPISNDPNVPKAQLLMVQAPHSSTMPDGSAGGNSIGFVLSFPRNGAHLSPDKAPVKPMKNLLADADAFTVYFACDSGYFTEMNWIGQFGIDLAVLPIGDRYTMGPSVSLDAILALEPRYVVPAHYNTWPPLAQNADKWADAVAHYTQAAPIVLTPGQSIAADESGNWK